MEIRPWPKGQTGDTDTPFLESIGAMPVDQIDGIGFADGASIGGTFTASRSPFGGVIRIATHLARHRTDRHCLACFRSSMSQR